jgi:phage tail-like protein
MAGQGTSEGRYLFEFDGITAIRASKVSGVSKDHKEFELYVGNQPNPFLGRGNFTCGDLNVQHADALNQTGAEVFQWLDDFISGRSVERRGGRLIILDEDGRTPVAIYELQDCVPKRFMAEDRSAGGAGASFFSFTIRPTDWQLF